jgi:hypothetical protein
MKTVAHDPHHPDGLCTRIPQARPQWGLQHGFDLQPVSLFPSVFGQKIELIAGSLRGLYGHIVLREDASTRP